MDPINYSAMLTQLDVTPLLRGLQVRDQRNAMEADTERRDAAQALAEREFTAKQQAEADAKADTAFTIANPTPENIRDFQLKYPERQAAWAKGWEGYNEAQQRDIIGTATGALGAMHTGNIDLARTIVTRRRDALKNSRIDTTETDGILAALSSDDPETQQKAVGALTMTLGAAVGADHLPSIMKSFGVGADAQLDRDKAQLELDRFEETKRANRVDEGVASARLGLSREAGARAERKAAGGGKGVSGGGGNFEYRIGPDGKLQRKRR